MKKVFCILICFILLFCFCIPSFAVYYDDEFPSSQTGLTGGSFIRCRTNLGEAVILIPINYRNDFLAVSTSGNLYNCYSSTITGTMYINNNQYSMRWSSFSYPEYRAYDSNYSYSSFTIYEVLDTNCRFLTVNDAVQNNNYYLEPYQIIVISLLISILFFVFLEWFLWHRKK